MRTVRPSPISSARLGKPVVPGTGVVGDQVEAICFGFFTSAEHIGTRTRNAGDRAFDFLVKLVCRMIFLRELANPTRSGPLKQHADVVSALFEVVGGSECVEDAAQRLFLGARLRVR